MKYIVVGLGNFGSALAEKLTNAGNEVIGVDSILSRVEALKTKATHVIALDCTDITAINALPIYEADCVIVAIREDFGASILITAMFKQLKVKRLISRAMSPLHQTVLEAIGVDEIVHPEEESAARLTEVLSLAGAIDVYSLFDKHKVVEVKLPARYCGMKVIDTDIRHKYHLNILTVIKTVERKGLIGSVKKRQEVLDYMDPATVLHPDDIIVLFGRSSDIRTFLND